MQSIEQEQELQLRNNQVSIDKREDSLGVVPQRSSIGFSQFLTNFESIIWKALPSMIVLELSIFSQIVNMYFADGSNEIIGIGVGTIWLNLTIIEVISNTNISISFLMNKHFRDQNSFRVGICFQRGLLISCIYLIIITPFLGFSGKLFNLIGLQENITEPAILYAWEVVPSTWAFAFFDITRNYLQAIGVSYPIIIIQIFASIIHIILAKQFMVTWALGVRGAAWAMNCSQFVQALLIYLYIVKNKSEEKSWVEWDKVTLKALPSWVGQLLRVGMKYFIQGCSFEIMLFMSISLSFQQITVSVCLAFTAKALSKLYLGMARIVFTLVQQSFKQMDITGAKQQAIYFVLSSLLVSILIGIMLSIFQDDWVNIFGLEGEAQQLIISLSMLFLLTSSLDGLQEIVASILNAIGDDQFTLNTQLVCHYGIGLMSGLYLGQNRDMGIRGLWLGWAIGLAVTSFLLLVRLSLIDWINAAKQILVVKSDK